MGRQNGSYAVPPCLFLFSPSIFQNLNLSNHTSAPSWQSQSEPGKKKILHFILSFSREKMWHLMISHCSTTRNFAWRYRRSKTNASKGKRETNSDRVPNNSSRRGQLWSPTPSGRALHRPLLQPLCFRSGKHHHGLMVLRGDSAQHRSPGRFLEVSLINDLPGE